MSREVKVLICGEQINVNKIDFCIPVNTRILNNINEIEPVIDSHSSLTRFIVLLLDELDQGSNAIVTRLSNRNNVTTLTCNNSMNNLPNLRNVLQISKNLITYKTTFHSICAYKSISKELYGSGGLNNEQLGAFFEEKANKLCQWLEENIEAKACDILIIPLNTRRGNLTSCQQAMIEMCKRLCGNKEIRVCTFYDYILFEESDLEIIDSLDQSDIQSQLRLRENIFQCIPKLAPIRLYLVGNENEIVHDLARVLIRRELNNGALKYKDTCTFMEYEPVKPEIRNNVAGFLRATWQLDRSRTIPIRLDDIERDANFKIAVESVYDTHPQREDHTKVAVWMQNANYCKTTSDFSDEFHSVDQAQTCRPDQDEDSSEATNARMLREYQKSPQNQ